MTRRISAVAVCCSSDSVTSALRACSSLNSRTFSIAITAWSANVLGSAISLIIGTPRATYLNSWTTPGFLLALPFDRPLQPVRPGGFIN